MLEKAMAENLAGASSVVTTGRESVRSEKQWPVTPTSFMQQNGLLPEEGARRPHVAVRKSLRKYEVGPQYLD
jgi:hypothetical protein